MTEPLGAPQSATVIAISLQARGDLARRRFTDLLSGVLAHSCHIQPATGQNNELAYTAIVPDSTQTLSLLRRLLSLQAEFGRIHPDCAARFMVHHGVIFPAAKNFWVPHCALPTADWLACRPIFRQLRPLILQTTSVRGAASRSFLANYLPTVPPPCSRSPSYPVQRLRKQTPQLMMNLSCVI